MNEMVSLKMGVKFASSLIMGEKLLQKLYVMIYAEIQYLVISDIRYNLFLHNKGILNRNHDYATLRSK